MDTSNKAPIPASSASVPPPPPPTGSANGGGTASGEPHLPVSADALPSATAGQATEGTDQTAAAASTNSAASAAGADTAFAAAHSAHAALAAKSAGPSRLHLLSSSVHSLYGAAADSRSHGGDQAASTSDAVRADAPPSSAPVSSPDTSLSRQQFHSLVAQIRQAAANFAQTSPAFSQQSSAQQMPSQPSQLLQPPSLEASATSNAVRRYVSLLAETSKHIAELRHSIDSFSPVAAPRTNDRVSSSAMSVSLARLRSLAASKDVSGHPDKATEALDALCTALEAHARALGLETFAERAEQTQTQPSSSTRPAETLVHTLTIGAKILVIDVELAVQRQDTDATLRPVVRLKLSYANDADHASPSRDPALADLLQRDVQSAADLLFGVDEERQRQQHQQQRCPSARIADCFVRLGANLEALLHFDEVAAQVHEAGPAAEVDVFDALQQLSSQVYRVAEAERQDAALAASASGSTEAAAERRLLERGHGIASVHRARPFLEVVYARDEVCQVDYRLSLGVGALDLGAESSPSDASSGPSWSMGSRALAALQEAQAGMDPSSKLGSVRRGASTVPVRFIAQLDPPVVVTRATAAKLASICRLPGSTKTVAASSLGGSNSQPASSADGAVWFEDVLASAWAQRPTAPSASDYLPRCSFTLARTPDSLRDPKSQGLIVDALPLMCSGPVSNEAGASGADAMDVDQGASSAASTAARLFAAIETLRDEVRTTELAHSALSSNQDDPGATTAPAAEPTLDELLGDAAPPSGPAKIPVVISWRGPVASATADPASTAEPPQPLLMDLGFGVAAHRSAQAGRSHLDMQVTVSPAAPSSPDAAWRVEVTSVLRGADPPAQTKKLAADDPAAQQLAAQLSQAGAASGLEALDRIVVMALEWAQAQLGVQAEIPAPPSAGKNDGGFDPSAYEEQNVHAVYETIAPHFSSTRYKSSDVAAARDTIAADSSPNSLLTIGVDRSSNLLSLAQTNFGQDAAVGKDVDRTDAAPSPPRRLHEVAVGDAMMSGLRTGVFDYAISIATIHHFSTWERRAKAVQELIRLVQPVASAPTASASPPEAEDEASIRLNGGRGAGRFMIFAWALEQKDEGKRQFEGIAKGGAEAAERKSKERLVSDSGLGSLSRREAYEKSSKDAADEQDLLVPWVLTQPKAKNKPQHGKGVTGEKGSRRGGRKDKPAEAPPDATRIEDDLSTLKVDDKPAEDAAPAVAGAAPVYQRYYHVFRSGELEALVEAAGEAMPVVHRRNGQLASIKVICEVSGWERGNWWGIWRVEWA
ncbi:uncharacterized protein PSFLO_02192 [Pseudozyma flocculosa]|uniref:Methyltransferase type 11 domain-containing protein n=1 Tax=Pseudozyma flocculosa TaxID=84751 RepID=A0A5C3F0D3_9BASI|nr:uncharacterized protein PSFLO_02192 [Pseudozyma flocculosa]